MSVEVQVPTVPHFKGLISGVEDAGSPLVWQYFYLMLFLLETAILLHKRGFVDSQMAATVVQEPACQMSTDYALL